MSAADDGAGHDVANERTTRAKDITRINSSAPRSTLPINTAATAVTPRPNDENRRKWVMRPAIQPPISTPSALSTRWPDSAALAVSGLVP